MFSYIVLIVAYCGYTHGIPVNATSRIHGAISRARNVCGGSIVSRRHVLTAAHCITPFLDNDKLSPSFHGRVGSNIWHSGGHIIHFQDHFIHPDWDEDLIKHDVGILVLTQYLQFGDAVAKIRLNFDWVGGGEKMSVTGWGTTTWRIIGEAVLLYVWTVTPQQCEEAFASDEAWAKVVPTLDICSFHSVGHGMCHGDSGSALVLSRLRGLSGFVTALLEGDAC